ncbi:MAG TPA: PQQ-binding-like beta-propeller repeat protein [Planctomycetaceae bacterium]|nr:PQQ-binding-like beta-propeller repeat protein [Planctomycetaceae bacterium]
MVRLLETLLCVLWLTPLSHAQEKSSRSDSGNPFLPAGAVSDGWTSVRGPHFDGHSAEVQIADTWPSEGPPVLWTRELGQGYSAFTANGNRIFTQAQSLGGQYVYCLDAETGETIWSYRYDWPYEAVGVYPGPRATPTISGDRVYFAGPSGLAGCLTIDKGRLVWSVNVVEKYAGDGGVGFGYSCSPIVSDGLVFLPVGGNSASLVALDAATGNEVWAAGDDPGSYSPVFPITYQDRKLLVGYLQNSLVIHDRVSGELLLRKDLSSGYDEHSAWPIYREPYLWIAAPFRSGSTLLRLPETLERTNAFEQVWSLRIMSNDVVSSVLVDGYLYGFDIFDAQAKTQRPSRGKFRCLDFLTGAEKWEQGSGVAQRRPDDNLDEIGQAGIIAVDGKLLLLNERGELILLRATPEECDILARTTVLGGELTWTPPALHRGRVYVRNHSRAVCIYVGDPELLEPEREVLRVEDIPQTKYFDLAAKILVVEPDYLFDVPSDRWLWEWYLACLGTLAGSGLIAFVVSMCVPKPRRESIRRWTFRIVAFTAGAVGTTLLSSLKNDFVFTWPVCLFVAFEPVVSAAVGRKKSEERTSQKWKDRLVLLPFLAVCLAYFLLCRRLSLVF